MPRAAVIDFSDPFVYTNKTVEDDMLLRRETTLTDAQIKALPTTAVQIIPAPGSAKMILLVTSCLQSNVTAGIYTNIATPTASDFSRLYLQYNGGARSSEWLYASVLLTDDSGFTPVAVLSPGHDLDVSISTNPILPTADGNSSSYVNKALEIKATNIFDGNYTGGNAANTLKIVVYYVVVDL